MSKAFLRTKAVELRKEGWSTTRIAKELGVSKSTSYLWCKDVEITEEQKRQLYKNQTSTWRKGVEVWVKKCRESRLMSQQNGKSDVDRYNWEHAAACMLWWAEGDKRTDFVGITNSDPHLLRFFVHCLKKYYKVIDKDCSISVQYHNQADEQQLVSFWKQVLDIPNAQVQKGYRKQSSEIASKYPYGICRIRVHDTRLANRMWGSVQGYIGFSCEKISEKCEQKI